MTKQGKKAFRKTLLRKRYPNYKAYLNSKEWHKIRDKVMRRAKGICEVCGDMGASEVHHKTYKRIYQEKLKDLLAVCKPCHLEVHGLLTEDLAEELFYEMYMDSNR